MFSLILISMSFNCWAQRNFDIEIYSSQPPLLVASAGEEPTLIGSDLVLGDIPTGSGGTEPYTYQWLPEDNLDNPNNANPIFTGGSTTEYTLLIIDNRGCSAADTTLILITGIGNSPESNVLKTYPNPGSGKIRIVAPENMNLNNTSILVFDASGRVVYTGPWLNAKRELLLDVNKLANGQYTLVLTDGIASTSNKIIIQ